MEKSEKIGAIAGALAKAQSQFPSIERTEKVDYITKTGVKIRYSYAPLAEIIKATKKSLGDNELCIVQAVQTDDSGVIIETMLAHSSGEWIASSYTIAGEAKDPQTMGSLITYGRRYGLSSLLDIAADEDDDATNVQKSKSNAEPTTQGEAGTTDHWCKEHNTAFNLKKGADGSRWYSHKAGVGWCNEVKEKAKAKPPKEIEELWIEEESPQETPEPSLHTKSATVTPAATEKGDPIGDASRGKFSVAENSQRVLPDEPAPEPLESTRSPSKEQTGIIDLDWLKKSVSELQEGGMKGWTKPNILGYLYSFTRSPSMTITEAVGKLNDSQARQFKEQVEHALKELEASKATGE